jgi:hypothetical protein
VELANGRESAEFDEAVDHAIEAGRRHGAFLQLVSLRAIAMLASAGVRSAVLKGPLMGEEIYGDPGRRPSSDIDLLVAPEDLQIAASVIRELGYGAATDYLADNGLPLLHLMLQHERRELPTIELHWRVHWHEESFACERLLPPAIDPLGKWRPSPADGLAALLLFYARDGFVDLRLASDLGAWWDAHKDAIPPAALGGLLSSYPELVRIIRAAACVIDKIAGVPMAQIMGSPPQLGLRERMAVRLANPHPHSSRAQIYADMGLVDALLMPRGGLGPFIRRNILPPREVLDQQARHAARRHARSPLSRGAGMFGRYVVTFARLARAPESIH